MSAKTHKGIRKRLKRTASGRLLRRRVGSNHLMSAKTPRRARRLRRWAEVASGEARALRKQYGNV